MSRYRAVVKWEESQSYEVEADDADEAGDLAMDLAYDEHPFADDYDVLWEPELLADDASVKTEPKP